MRYLGIDVGGEQTILIGLLEFFNLSPDIELVADATVKGSNRLL